MNGTQDRLNELIERLRESGLRLTPQRMAVLQVLLSSQEHLNVDQIYKRVKADFPMTSRATVYKTMTLLKELDEVLELEFTEGGSRYDGIRPGPHPHVICVECDRIMDLDLKGVDDLTRRASERSGFRVIDHRLDFYGLCPDCQSE